MGGRSTLYCQGEELVLLEFKNHLSDNEEGLGEDASKQGMIDDWKRISEKRTKNQAKTDKTGHRMEKCGKDKLIATFKKKEGPEVLERRRIKNYRFEETKEGWILIKIPVEAKIDEKDEQSTKLDDNTAGEKAVMQQCEELMNKRKKHFAMLRAEEKRRKPPTKAQKRNQMSTYQKKHGGATKHNQLKSKSYEEIQKMFDNEMRRVNTFIPMDSEVVKKCSEKNKSTARKKMLGRKRAGKEQQQESSKKQRLEKDKESNEVKEDDEDALKKYLVIKKDDDIAIDVIPLATKLPVIVDYKLHKEGLMAHYELIRADGTSRRYTSMIRLLQGIDKEDLQILWKLVKIKRGDIRPEDEHERVLWGDLKVMFEPDIKSDLWRNLQGYKVKIWKLIDSCGVHFVSAAGEKNTTADYNCLKTFYCQEDKDELKR
ncbi:hypothetical protein Tco_0421757 [Tanacetum coccineum]